jgi:multiple sugar transport system ATP-binding protein
MMTHGGGRPPGITAFDRVDDAAMPQCRRLEIPRHRAAGNLEPVIMHEATVKDGIKRRQVGILEDAPMEIAVEGRKLQLVTRRSRKQHLVEQALEFLDQRAAASAHDARHAVALYLLTQPEHLDCLVFRALGNLRPTMPATTDQPFLLKLQERFPDGALAALEVGRQFQFRKAGPRRQRPEHDVALQRIEGGARLGRSDRCRSSGKIGHLTHPAGCTFPKLSLSILISISGVKLENVWEDLVAGIALKKIRKSYGALQVIHDINIEIQSGEFLVLVGPSGCGKSTLLRMIAGLEEISGGELDIEGRTVNLLPPAERNIAMVFQDYALYPHMSVRENMSFGLKMRGGDDREIESRVGQAADVLKIRDYLDRRPAQLSGGQRQRVAMGRAIVREPAAFLFDEPLSNLDAALRVEMRLEIAKLHNRMKATTVYVTHDQVEAMTLADRIVVMNGGVVEQIGKPLDLYHNPSSLFVARFIGSPTMNTLPAEIASDGESLKLLGKTAAGSIPGARTLAGEEVTLGIRPEELTPCSPEQAWFSGELMVAERLGSQTYGYVEVGHSKMLTVEFPRDRDIAVGEMIHVKGNPERAHLFDAETGKRLN